MRSPVTPPAHTDRKYYVPGDLLGEEEGAEDGGAMAVHEANRQRTGVTPNSSRRDEAATNTKAPNGRRVPGAGQRLRAL